ncbi:MAG: rhomboid family intramembrane serine protease [Pseudomonadota bacterium]
MSSPEHISPVNPLPPVVVALFLVMMGVEAVFSLGARGIIGGPGAIGWRLDAIQTYAFSGDIFDWMVSTGRWPPEHVIRFLSYVFVHANFTHAIFAGVLFLAMGKMTAEAFGAVPMLVVFFLSAIGGALAYAILFNDPVPIVGAFPPVYGLIGAYTFMLWRSYDVIGANKARAFTLIGFLMGIQLVFGLLFGRSNDWVADLAGFATGFALSFVVSPGGWRRLRDRIRRG